MKLSDSLSLINNALIKQFVKKYEENKQILHDEFPTTF